MRIEVTAEDIAKGKRDRQCHCPIALAVKRTLGVEQGVRVAWDLIGLPEGEWVRLPKEASDFVVAFDDGRPVQPFAFEIPQGATL